MKDVNPIVAGNGLKKLQEAGIEIIGPILEDECKKLNEVFIKNQTKHKTFVALKTATTIDGKIATQTGDSKWITSEDVQVMLLLKGDILHNIICPTSTRETNWVRSILKFLNDFL